VYKLKKRKNILSYIKIKNKQCCFASFVSLYVFVSLFGFWINVVSSFICFVCERLPYSCASQQHLNISSSFANACISLSQHHIFVPLNNISTSSLCIVVNDVPLNISRFSLCLQVRLRLRLHQYSSAILVWQIRFILSWI